MVEPPTPDASLKSREPLRLGAVFAVLLALGFVVWLLVSRGGDEPTRDNAATSATPFTGTSATIMPIEELQSVPDRVGHPVYWAGEMPGKEFEVTILEDRTVFVRYVPSRLPAGVDKPAFLTIVTYQRPDAFALVQKGGQRPGAILVRDRGGALVTAEGDKSKNAFFAFEGASLLVEVFDPEPGKAFQEIQSGRVQMIQ